MAPTAGPPCTPSTRRGSTGWRSSRPPAGSRLHGAAEEGVPFRDIATVIGEQLGVPAVGITAEEAVEQLGFVGAIAAFSDIPRTSSARTRDLLGLAARAAHPARGSQGRALLRARVVTSDVVAAARETLGPVGAYLPLGFTSAPPIDLQRNAVGRLERAVFPTTWTNEVIGGKDALVALAVLLAATERMTFGTGLDAASDGAWGKGAGKSFAGGVGEGAKGNEGTSAAIKNTVGSITYNEWSFAKSQNLSVAKIITSAGPDPVELTTETAGKAIDGVKIKGEGNDLVLDTSSFYKPTETGSYPIMLGTYEIVCSKYSDPEVSKAVKAFLTSALGNGQKGLEDNGYIPVPDAFKARLTTAVNAIS